MCALGLRAAINKLMINIQPFAHAHDLVQICHYQSQYYLRDIVQELDDHNKVGHHAAACVLHGNVWHIETLEK